ncbi:unannotated protein [freshwater metagenome]|uniref:Unannotated protein n=1 Tax=freshwater metagenome TaxID=449393 RepID=A0A6J7L9W7_9ZZZZ|nr:hypothetical protein [Actinomycetota bacterium]
MNEDASGEVIGSHSERASPLLYLVWVPVRSEPKIFSDWYMANHAPNLINAGFLSMNHCSVLNGSVPLLNYYEVSDMSSFGDGYARTRTSNPQVLRNEAEFSSGPNPGFVKAIYKQISYIDAQGACPPLVRQRLMGPVVVLARFNGDNSVVSNWHKSSAQDFLQSSGSLVSRLACLNEAQHPQPIGGIETREFLIAVEAANVDLGFQIQTELSKRLEDLRAVDTVLVVVSIKNAVCNPECWSS